MLPKWRYCHSFITIRLTHFQDNYIIVTLFVNCILGLSQPRNNRGWRDGLLQTISSACCGKRGKSNRIPCQDNPRSSRYKNRITPEHKSNIAWATHFEPVSRFEKDIPPQMQKCTDISNKIIFQTHDFACVATCDARTPCLGYSPYEPSVLLQYCAPSLDDYVRRFGTALWYHLQGSINQ